MLKPIDVTNVDLALGGDMKKLLPPYEQIPSEFKTGNNKWNKVVTDWFCTGLKECKLLPKEGIDAMMALKHVKAVICSFEPKHEHKMAGCAYLISEFFEDVIYDTSK